MDLKEFINTRKTRSKKAVVEDEEGDCLIESIDIVEMEDVEVANDSVIEPAESSVRRIKRELKQERLEVEDHSDVLDSINSAINAVLNELNEERNLSTDDSLDSNLSLLKIESVVGDFGGDQTGGNPKVNANNSSSDDPKCPG